MTSQLETWNVRLNLLASAAMIVASAAVGYAVLRQPKSHIEVPPIPRNPLGVDGAQRQGGESARVALIEFGDLQCPYCRRFAKDIFPDLQREYVVTGKVLFVFRHLPLTNLHPVAFRAAEGAECAARQEKFWPMFDALLGATQPLDEGYIVTQAGAVGLDKAQFQACFNGEASGVIRADVDSAQALGVKSTPTFFLGSIIEGGKVKVRKVISGAQPAEQFRAAIDSALGSR